MDVSIRAAREHELDELGELTARAYLDDGLLSHEDDGFYLAELRDARRRAAHTQVLVAVDEERDSPLGTVAYVGQGGEFAEMAGPGEAEFRMLAVRAEGRGRGVGEALVRACLTRARAAGLRRVVISSQPAMTAAHRLYGRLGFRRTPERDWEPIPGLVLWAFVRELTGSAARAD